MKVLFLGTGEAFDESRNNTSILINEELLLECGYSVPQILWKTGLDKKIKYIFVSHFHADHVGGIPMLLMRLRQEKRKEPLTLIGGKGFRKRFLKFFDMCYKGFFGDLPFKVKFLEVSAGDRKRISEYTLSFEKGYHLRKPFSIENLAIRVSRKGKVLVYSGDTSYTERLINFSRNCTLLIHEAYLPHNFEYHRKYLAHCSPFEAGKIAKEAKAKALALVHIHRRFVKEKERILEEVREVYKGKVLIPEDGDEVKL